jgi:hypothetical protein
LAALRSTWWALTALLCLGLFGAASALAVGGANLTPGHLSLAFFLGAVAIRKGAFDRAFLSIRPGTPGLVLLALTVWAVCSSFIMPRLFAGEFLVFPLNSQFKSILEVPLMPTGANFNQAVYFSSGIMVFAAVSSIINNDTMMRRAANAVLFASGVSLIFVLIDTVTFAAGLSHLLNFVRNADYAQLFSHQFLGVKRVTAFLPEASAYAIMACGFFAFNFRLWRSGVRAELTGPLSLATFVTVLFSFSSTGYVALIAYLSVVLLGSMFGIDRQASTNPHVAATNQRIFLSLIPFTVLAAAIAVALKPDLLDPIVATFDRSITSKLSSASGVERTAWNMGGVRAFFETYGLGAGLGSVRTSSFAVAVIANLGIIGTLLYACFFAFLFQDSARHPYYSASAETRAYASAAKSACFAYIIATTISGSSPDMGFYFFGLAGMASGSIFYMDGRRRQMAESQFTEIGSADPARL